MRSKLTKVIAALAAVTGAGLLASAPALAQDRAVVVREDVTTYTPTVEVGVQAGVPTGLSAKYWISPFHGLQFGLTWRFPDDGYSASADYVAHSYILHARQNEPQGMRIPLYAGAGVKALRLSSDDPVYGARFPLGAQVLLEALPVSIFAEVAPGAIFEKEGPEFSADAGVGARVYF